MRVLVSGGTGYVGSHVCVDLMEAGHEVIVVDNLVNSRNDVLERIASIVGRRPRFLCLDIRHAALLRAALRPYDFDGVIHLAGLESIEESMREPADYYRTNVSGTANVIEAAGDCPFVLSSSAAVYGNAASSPIVEDQPIAPANPYGRSKYVAEMVVRDVVQARGSAGCVLRLFNTVGAHESGRLGEDPRGAPSDLMPLVAQVAVGVRERLGVHGNDYPTHDGTGVRDYLHVMDASRAHRLALESLAHRHGVSVYNVGSGRGYSVLEVIDAFERATGQPVPYRIEDRRPGDVAEYWADASRARDELGWAADRDLPRICVDSLRWRRFWLDCLRPAAATSEPAALLATRSREARSRPRSRPRRPAAIL